MGCSGKCPGWDEHVPGRGIIAEVQCGSARCPRGQTAEVPEWGELRVAARTAQAGVVAEVKAEREIANAKVINGIV